MYLSWVVCRLKLNGFWVQLFKANHFYRENSCLFLVNLQVKFCLFHFCIGACWYIDIKIMSILETWETWWQPSSRGRGPTHLVLCHGVLNSLSGGLDRSWAQNQLVQPGQQTLQPLLHADRLGHRGLQLLGTLRHRRRQRVEPPLQAIWGTEGAEEINCWF